MKNNTTLLAPKFRTVYGAPIYADALVEVYELPAPTSRCTCARCGEPVGQKGTMMRKFVDSQATNGGISLHVTCPNVGKGTEWAHEKGNHDVREIPSNNVDTHRVTIATCYWRREWLARHGFHTSGADENEVVFVAENGWNTGHVLPQFFATNGSQVVGEKVDDKITVNGRKVSNIGEYAEAIRKKV